MKDCNQCGKCCIHYSQGGLSATQEEIDMWEIFKPDIFRYVKDGEIWADPVTGSPLALCPWLEKAPNEEKYSCKIYEDRPDDCKHYPVTIKQMQKDECEMLELTDLDRPRQAQKKLDQMMILSRPPVLP